MKSRQLLEARLKLLDEKNLRRSLKLPQGIDLCSNDYLGFASDEVLRKRIFNRIHPPSDVATGSTGSRLLSGQSEEFDRLEKRLAEFSGTESALYFPSGYQANLGLLSAILQSGDVVFSDELNHASLIDGMKLSPSERKIFKHRDLKNLQTQIANYENTPGLKVLVTESIFSMDGDTAPLKELADFCTINDCLLIVDEAHATGLYGNFSQSRGSGLVDSLGIRSQVFATTHTAGKSLGCSGAWIAGDSVLKDILINFSRPFIFSTAPSPMAAAALSEAITYWQEVGPERALAVRERSKHFRKLMGSHESNDFFDTPIFSYVCGENARAVQVSKRLQAQGFDIRAIRPPTVPEGTARLRMTIKWKNQSEDLNRLASELSP